ncbi:uncharacterized protein LOC123537018 [Mercenaria mercenaria]|uniref:uncharacterized protein LOC123537018 n=1 Tax=Mercenaria mercenaria TaxID=6596 RepID=UPI00234E5A76|nr:uncharacterized protein LOC123537018 [Mercenaria mercenaria]XP_045176490.2 uncharacterized protein LOC123537018 [Mercenaria mercenaria]
MRNLLHRSVSSYHSSQPPKTQSFIRHVSVPCDVYRQELCDEDPVMECIADAAATFSKVWTTVLHSPETVFPDYSSVEFQPRLSDAEILLPDIACLATNNKLDALPMVQDILTKIQQEAPHLESQNLSFALNAVKNAIILLHLHEQDDINVDIIITQPREIIAATMIVHEYLNNLTHPKTSGTRCL